MIQDERMKELLAIIENTNDPIKLRNILDNYHEFDIAEVLPELDDEKRNLVLSIFNNEELAEILSYTEGEDTSDILGDIDEDKVASIINEMEPDDATDILGELEEEQADKVLELLDTDMQDDIKELSGYDEDTAGSMMNSNYLQVNMGADVKDAMRIVVKEAPDAETIDTIFVVDSSGNLKGTLDLKKLIVTKSPRTVDDIMTTHFQAVEVNDSAEAVVKQIRNYGTYVMPVLDKGLLKGIITMDDAFDALSDVVEEDYAKLAGITDSEEQDENVGVSIKKRIPWLIILLFLDVVVSLIISGFGDVIQKLPILVFFQAAVLGLAGNCGTQALAVSVRRISMDHLNTKKAVFKHLGKELSLGMLTGLVLGIVSFALVTAMLYIKNDFDIDPIRVGLVLGIAILVSVTVSNLFGAIIPIIFYKCKVDPAVASGPFITTINDIVVVLLYFTIAMVILSNYL